MLMVTNKVRKITGRNNMRTIEGSDILAAVRSCAGEGETVQGWEIRVSDSGYMRLLVEVQQPSGASKLRIVEV
jgi:hypothetical protein